MIEKPLPPGEMNHIFELCGETDTVIDAAGAEFGFTYKWGRNIYPVNAQRRERTTRTRREHLFRPRSFDVTV